MSTEATAPAVEMVTIAEAAKRLDVSADTIRRRLKRGELTGEQRRTKAGQTWFIAVPASTAPPEAAVSTEDREELLRLRERVAGLERIVEVSQREKASMQEERDAWRRTAEESNEAQRELRVLLANALTALPEGKRTPALAGGDVELEAETPEKAGIAAKVKRLFGFS